MSDYASKYLEEYQDLALATLIRHPRELVHLVPCLKANYFEGVESTLTAEAILSYHQKRGRFPAFIVLAQLVSEAEKSLGLDRDEDSAGVKYVRRLEEMDTGDWEKVRDDLVAFAKEQAIKSALRTSIGLLREHKEPAGGFVSLFEEAMRVGENIDNIGLSLYDDAAATVRKVTGEEYGVSTGFPVLDEIWKRGWKPGWLVVPLAPPKRFKSLFCTNLALNMSSAATKYNVLYYACEISEELAFMRALCNVTNLQMDQAYDAPEAFIASAEQAIQQRDGGALIFKSFPSKGATIGDIEAHARMVIQQGVIPHVIIVDYAETIKPTKRDKDEGDPRQQANIYTDARAMASRLQVVVVMPDRCNRETVDRPVPNMKSFQGAFEKAGVVDVAMGLCQTEEERKMGLIRYFVFLNRHGPDMQHMQGRVDASRSKMEIERFIPYEPEDEGVEISSHKKTNTEGRKLKSKNKELLDD